MIKAHELRLTELLQQQNQTKKLPEDEEEELKSLLRKKLAELNREQ